MSVINVDNFTMFTLLRDLVLPGRFVCFVITHHTFCFTTCCLCHSAYAVTSVLHLLISSPQFISKAHDKILYKA